jgi:hypothetical protein
MRPVLRPEKPPNVHFGADRPEYGAFSSRASRAWRVSDGQTGGCCVFSAY